MNLWQLYIFKDKLTELSSPFLKNISILFFPHLKDHETIPCARVPAPQSLGVDFAGFADVCLF